MRRRDDVTDTAQSWAERAQVRTAHEYLLWRVAWGRMPFNTRKRPDGAFYADEWSGSDLWRLLEQGGVVIDGARVRPKDPVAPQVAWLVCFPGSPTPQVRAGELGWWLAALGEMTVRAMAPAAVRRLASAAERAAVAAFAAPFVRAQLAALEDGSPACP